MKQFRSAHAVRRPQLGITLVEMMVAMVVGLILLVGIVQLFVSNKQAYRIQEGANVLNENARYVMNQIQFDLRMADHWGGVEAAEIDVPGTIAAIGNDCSGTAATLEVAGVFGFDGAATSPLDCIPNSDYVPNSDIVIVRYAEPIRVASGNLVNDQVYVRTAIGRRGVVFQGANKADLPGDLMPDDLAAATVEDENPDTANFAYRTVIYFLRPCASQDLGTAGICDAADDTTPTLARLSLNGMALVEQDIIAGVEQMQFAYGLDDDGDRSPDRYLSAADVTTSNAWERVIDVKLSVLIRNNEIDVTADGEGTTYKLYGGAGGDGIDHVVPADAARFRRKIFNTSIQVRNMTRG